jgi:hypothetical protein
MLVTERLTDASAGVFLRVMINPPLHQTYPQVVWIDVQCFADILERIWPGLAPPFDPGLSFPKEFTAPVGVSAMILLKALDRVSQNRKHKFLFRIEM